MRINERSEGLINNLSDKIFHILGCGAIGSSAAIHLARMGATNFVLYDMDKVEIVNIGVSQYNLSDISKRKVTELSEHLRSINSDVYAENCHGAFTGFFKKLDNEDIVIIGFDNMTIRKESAEYALSNGNKPFLLVDGRMGAEEYQQYVFPKPTLKKYMKYWYSDDEASGEPCNAKATSYCSNMSGAFIANAVKKVMNDEPYNEEFFFNFPNYNLGKSVLIA